MNAAANHAAARAGRSFARTATPDSQVTEASLRFGAAIAPALVTFICAVFGVLWLAPLASLLAGGAALMVG